MLLDKGQLHLETPWLGGSLVPEVRGGMTQGQGLRHVGRGRWHRNKRLKQPLLSISLRMQTEHTGNR